MTERRVATCKGCGAPIRWTKTAKDKNMPIDDEPNSGGRFVIEGDDEPPKVRFLRENEDYAGDRFTSHFETCSERDRFRKKR